MIAENTNGKVTLDVEGYPWRVRQEENAQHKMICHQVKSTGRGQRQDQQAKTKGELNQLPRFASADFGQGITIWNSSQKRC